MARQRHEDFQKDLETDPNLGEKESNLERAKRKTAEFLARGDGMSSMGLGATLPQLNIRHIPEGFEYSLQSCMTANGDSLDWTEVSKLGMVQWEIVPATRHPEITGVIHGMDKTYISIGHLILMERPSEVGVIDKRRGLQEMLGQLSTLGDVAREKFTGSSHVTPSTSIKKEGPSISLLSQDLTQYSDPISQF